MLKNISLSTLVFVLMLSYVHAYAKSRVLLIESYHSEYQWDKELLKGFKTSLQGQVELLTFQMDTKRLKKDQYSNRADLAWQYYKECTPDIVVLTDDNALKYLGPRFLETKTPVVYTGINENPRKYIALNKNITGVLERPLYKRTIKYLKDILYIGEGKILILLDKGTTTQAFKNSVFSSADSMVISGVQTDIKLLSSFARWMEVVETAQDSGYKAIVIGLYHRIFEDGNYIDSEKVLEWTSVNTPVPLFAFWGMSVGKGKAIGGMVLDGEKQGMAAGKMVLEILGGVPVQNIRPVIPDQGKFVFSRYELNRWKIRLPYNIKKHSKIIE